MQFTPTIYTDKCNKAATCKCTAEFLKPRLSYALSLPMEHRPQITHLYASLSCDVTSIFLKLQLKLAAQTSVAQVSPS